MNKNKAAQPKRRKSVRSKKNDSKDQKQKSVKAKKSNKLLNKAAPSKSSVYDQEIEGASIIGKDLDDDKVEDDAQDLLYSENPHASIPRSEEHKDEMAFDDDDEQQEEDPGLGAVQEVQDEYQQLTTEEHHLQQREDPDYEEVVADENESPSSDSPNTGRNANGNIFYGQHSRMQSADMQQKQAEAMQISKEDKIAEDGFNLKSQTEKRISDLRTDIGPNSSGQDNSEKLRQLEEEQAELEEEIIQEYEKEHPKKESLKLQERDTRITDEERMINEIEQMSSPTSRKKKQQTTITILVSDHTEDTRARGIDEPMSIEQFKTEDFTVDGTVHEADREEDDDLPEPSPGTLQVGEDSSATPQRISRNQTSFFSQATRGRRGMQTEEGDLTDVLQAPIPDDVVGIIKETWETIKSQDLESIGVQLMKNLFNISHEALLLFPFKGEDSLFESRVLKEHALKLIGLLQLCIDNIQNLQQLHGILYNRGWKHRQLGLLKVHYSYMKQAMLKTIYDHLVVEVTSEIKKAWHFFLSKLMATMISDNYDKYLAPSEIKSHLNAMGSPDYKHSDSPANLMNKLHHMATIVDDEDDDDKLGLTPQQASMVHDSWQDIKQTKNIGLKIFGRLFEIEPNSLPMFQITSTQNLEKNETLVGHVNQVILTLNSVIRDIEDFKEVQPLLFELSGDHAKLNIPTEFFDKFQRAALYVFERILGKEKFKGDLKMAWKQALHLILTSLQMYCKPGADEEMFLRRMTEAQSRVQASLSHDKQTDRMTDSTFRDDSSRHLLPGEQMSLVPSRKGSQMSDMKLSTFTQNNKGEVQAFYRDMFRKEVDFHHKLAYRFEKTFRLSKKMPGRKQILNLEIVDCIGEHSGYIEQDPMALFYCLFFCIQYNNPEVVEFLRKLIQNMKALPQIDLLLEHIDVYGVQRLRRSSEMISMHIYHMVLYQAFTDNLRIVYSQIMQKLKFIQLRDSDALHLLKTRDYDLIRMSFKKHTAKINLTQYYMKLEPMKSSTYRSYNQAYFEEIIITNNVDKRVVFNYRERFLVTARDIYIVFEMYCKEDYDEPFKQTPKEEITPKQFVDLFIICLRNDSFKIAMLIYMAYLSSADMNQAMMDIVIQTIKESPKFMEMKIFLLLQHLDVLTIEQMNRVLDTYHFILNSKDPKMNPLVNQYNVIKIALMIYRICFKIEEKQIYSLITKCGVLQQYIVKSLCSYLELQNNILVLFKFMSEPILHLTERKDSLDIMYEMNMQELLKHPVVVEVLNLVYEGKFSISASPMSLSPTIECLIDMKTVSFKRVSDRIIENIKKFGESESTKQTTLQFNIWKYCIQQREWDEMFYFLFINTSLIIGSIGILIVHNFSQTEITDIFSGSIVNRLSVLINGDDERLGRFCPKIYDHLQQEQIILLLLNMLVWCQTVGAAISIVQSLIIIRYKDNATLNKGRCLLQMATFTAGMLFEIRMSDSPQNRVFSTVCSRQLAFNDMTVDDADFIFSLQFSADGQMSFKMLLSAIIVITSLQIIVVLQKAKVVGEIVLMLTQTIYELAKFAATFGIIIILYVIVGTLLVDQLKFENNDVILDLFNSMNDNQNYHIFTTEGKLYITSFLFIFRILLVSLLAGMFINKYSDFFKQLDAHKRFNIIKQKNSVGYDKHIGGLTMTFFPINVLIIPFMIPILFFRSPRLNETALKWQYWIMMLSYLAIGVTLAMVALPFLYFKIVLNNISIWLKRGRQEYKFQNLANVAISFFLGPAIVSLSLLIDVVSMPRILLKGQKQLEHKYQMASEQMTPEQTEQVIILFDRIFFGEWASKFKGKTIVLKDLMRMHSQKFGLIDNLHELVCQGTKDYREALQNVSDYNMSKIITAKCSVPDKGGQFKLAKCELGIIQNVYEDIYLFNYVDTVFRRQWMGTLLEDVDSQQKRQLNFNEILDEEEEDNAAPSRTKSLKRKETKQNKNVSFSSDEEEQDEEGDDEDDSPMAGAGVELGPDGVPLWRNTKDHLNNFFINDASSAFTDVGASSVFGRNYESKEEQALEHQIIMKHEYWKEQVAGSFEIVSLRIKGVFNEYIGNLKEEGRQNAKAAEENDKMPRMNSAM